MKKRILFIIPSLAAGGAEKSLTNLLRELDYSRYDADLMLFRREGLFLSDVPEAVNILDAGEEYLYFDGSIGGCLLYCLKKTKPLLALKRILYALSLRKKESVNKRRTVWKYLSSVLPETELNYDLAVGYLEGNSIYYCVEKVRASKKAGYIHSDYSKLLLNPEFDREFLLKLDFIMTVSEACAESLVNAFPYLFEKIKVVENIISSSEIKRLSTLGPGFPETAKGIKMLTVGRLSPEKGIDLALEACELLTRRGIDFIWAVVGGGSEAEPIAEKAKSKSLEARFILLGEQKNPYGYLAQCDIYVQPSRYEGKSIAVEEAKLAAKPVVVTRYSTVNDQIEDSVSGLIAEMNPQSIAEKILVLIENPSLMNKLSRNLTESSANYISGAENLYELFED